MTQQKIRCAVYTRKSTEEGLDQEFNTLDAQREAAEAYIASQKSEGWVCLPTRYDDGGFSGGNMDRPALKRLLEDVDAGKVDCIVVYKVDRLSRSLLDFARIVETLEENGVSFVSVTQQFNTTNSMGRLTLNILLSFAQFEREIIAERTSDKMTAARKKGKWTGGQPVLGYDVHPDGGRITVNEEEAEQVQAIFQLYLEKASLNATVQELNRRGWHKKQWVNRKGSLTGGRPFDRPSLYRLLTNPIYLGKVRCKGKLYEGEHEAILDESLWRRVQARICHNGRTGGADVRNRYGALLKGILYCGSCGVPMVHSYTQKKSGLRYRYYVCRQAQKQGWQTCPTKSVPAAEIERFVMDRIRCIGEDPAVLAETLAQVREMSQRQVQRLQAEHRTLLRELEDCQNEVKGLISLTARNGDGRTPATSRLAELQEQIRLKERRATEIREELVVVQEQIIDEDKVRSALQMFDPVWDALSPHERVRIVRLLVEQVVYDGEKGSIAITFRPSGIKALATEAELEQED